MIEITRKMPSMQMKDLKIKPREDLERLAAGLGISASVQYKKIKQKDGKDNQRVAASFVGEKIHR